MGRTFSRLVLAALVSCGTDAGGGPSTSDGPAPVVATPPAPPADAGAPSADVAALPDFGLGARMDRAAGVVRFRVWSKDATHVQLALYALPRGEDERLARELVREGDTPFWSVDVPLDELRAKGIGDVFYGYRVWGPNFDFDPSWTKGSLAGFSADVDAAGHRFNPNKLLFDPYALELSHDPYGPGVDGRIYQSGAASRAIDTGRTAPKSIVLEASAKPAAPKPTRALGDDVIYEVQVRGFTMKDPSVPERERGTFLGAARKAAYLKALGVTAVELLPIHETQNDQNDTVPLEQNYWGYATLDWFAPDRRFAADRSPGGPTRELRAMVDAFHAEGIKVFLDVVFNHTGEGGDATLFSWRGFGATDYYEPTDDPRRFVDNNGVGPNFHPRSAPATQLVLDALLYAYEYLGVDGFRFDLASVLGDRCSGTCFQFDKLASSSVLNRAAATLPARATGGGVGADLVAEPWAIGLGTYQLGNFPKGWAEWNGAYRDVLRTAFNRVGVADVTPRAMATRLLASPDLFADDGRAPSASIDFLVAHDGFTLRDLFTFDQKQNAQPPPFGPSSGGSDDNISWSHGGVVDEQRKAARTAFTLLATSTGVPMMLGGDELYRTQRGNNNAYNLDNEATWLDWTQLGSEASFHAFVSGLFAFRHAHAALRPRAHFDHTDHDGNGLADVTLLAEDGTARPLLDDGARRFLALRFDGVEAGDVSRSIYVAYNWDVTAKHVTLPTATWRLAADAHAGVVHPAGDGPLATAVDLAPRSVMVFVEP